MSKARFSIVAIAAVMLLCSIATPAEDAPKRANHKPLQADVILALVAGDALPQNIAHEIAQDGIAFRPDDAYRAQLNAMGADASVISAVNAATVAAEAPPLDQSTHDLLQHYVAAAQKIKAKDYQGASDELTAIAKASMNITPPAFVMGEVFRLQNRFPESFEIYSAIVGKDPGFPQVGTKLSYIEIKMGNSEEAYRLAKAALAEYPDNVEAHRDACLSLEDLREYEAGATECREALRLFPDYPSAHLDLGLILLDERKVDDAITEFKRTLTLQPDDALNLYDMGYAYDTKGDLASAISFYANPRPPIQIVTTPAKTWLQL